MKKRADLLDLIIAPKQRIIWGLLLLPCVALTASWRFLLPETAVAVALAALSAKRLRPLANLGFIAAMAAFSALAPRGHIFYSLGFIKLTDTAVIEGIERGLAIVCMVYVSGFAVSSGLRLPGAFGELLSGTLSRFNLLMGMRARVDPKDLTGSIDKILFSIHDPDAAEGAGIDTEGAPPATSNPSPIGRRPATIAAGAALASLTVAAAAWAAIASRLS